MIFKISQQIHNNNGIKNQVLPCYSELYVLYPFQEHSRLCSTLLPEKRHRLVKTTILNSFKKLVLPLKIFKMTETGLIKSFKAYCCLKLHLIFHEYEFFFVRKVQT